MWPLGWIFGAAVATFLYTSKETTPNELPGDDVITPSPAPEKKKRKRRKKKSD